MTKPNDREQFNRATTDAESANAPGDSRGVGGAVPCDSGSNLTRKTIRRNMIERLAANERGDIYLDDAEYDTIIKTLGSVLDDENSDKILPILPEKTIPNLPIPPASLTRGCPNSNFPQNCPQIFQSAQPAQPNKGFHFGGYDGGFTVGLEGEYREGCLERLCRILDDAKEKTCENRKVGKKVGKYDFKLFGYDVTISSGTVTEGLTFKYRLDVGGMRVLIRDKTTKGYQSIRVRFSTEVLMVNSAPANWQRLLEFFDAIGFVVTNDCISRVDFQLTCDFFTVADVVSFLNHNHIVRKTRAKAVHSTGDGSKEEFETVRLGTGSNPVQFEFYDKWKELHSGGNYGTQKSEMMLEKIGVEWANSDRPVTRFEIRVKREGLKAIGINSVDDLFGNEWAAINLLTQDWLRILNEPKKDGKEYKQQNHPVWDRVRNALYQHFNGKNFDDKAEWIPPAPVSGDPVALEKQAVGCIAKALAVRKGTQATEQDTMKATTNLLDLYKKPLHEKINTIARHMENKTGIPLGDSICEPSWKAELREYYRRSNQEDREKLRESERELRQSIEEPLATIDNASLERARARARDGFPVAEQEQFYDAQGETTRERWDDFMDKTKDIHLRR